MADLGVYSEKLSYFSRMLRREGLTVGPRETADACLILTHLGFSDREAVKTALRTVYAKSREEQLTFDRVFDGFFISEAAMREQAKRQMEKEQEMAQARQEATEDLEGTSFSEEQKELYAAMSQEQRQKLRDIKQKFDRDIGRNNPGLYGNFIHSVFARASKMTSRGSRKSRAFSATKPIRQKSAPPMTQTKPAKRWVLFQFSSL